MEKEAKQAETKKFTLLITHENNSILQLIQRTLSFGKLVRIFSYERKFIQTVKQIKKQIRSTRKHNQSHRTSKDTTGNLLKTHQELIY